MFFSRLTLKPEVGQIQLLKEMGRNKYQLHQLLWRLFEGESTRGKTDQGRDVADFHFRADYPEDQLLLHVVSAREPKNQDGIWGIDTVSYEENLEKRKIELTSGVHLQFYLRANPTIALYGRHKSQRHDALMHAKVQLKELLAKDSGRKPDKQEVWEARQQAARKWLVGREENFGAVIESDHLIIDEYRQERLHVDKKAKPIFFSTVDYQGILTITDPGTFKKTLFHGLGKSKAFGCGLLLVRRI